MREQNRQVHVAEFTGYIDKDSDLRYVRPGNYLDALNVYPRSINNKNVKTVIPGDALVSYTLPSGTNKCIGAFEDPISRDIVYCVYNSLGNHSILKYDGSSVTRLASGSYLNFADRVVQGVIVNSQFLYFADGKDTNGSIAGNAPRKLNISKANLNKVLEYELILNSDCYDLATQYYLTVTDLDGNVITPSTLVLNILVPSTPGGVVADLESALGVYDVDLSYDYIDVTGANKIIISHQDPERIVNISIPGKTYYYYGLNHYSILTDNLIHLAKPVPANPLEPEYFHDSGRVDTRIYGSAYQFRYRYVFDDGEKSAWSPASYVPTNWEAISGATKITEAENSDYFNAIRFTLNDSLIDSNEWRQVIKKIEISVRDSDVSIWRLATTYLVTDIIDTNEIRFYNDQTYPAVESDDIGQADQQVLKNFDFVPEKCLSIEGIYDSQGGHILALSSPVMGKDNPALKASVSTYTVSLTIPPGAQTQSLKTFKAGGAYRLYVVFEDFFGRQGAAIPLGRINLPFFQQVGAGVINPYGIELQITGSAPAWAERFRIAMTKNQNQSTYAQFPVYEVRYVQVDKTTFDLTDVAKTDAEYIVFYTNTIELPDDIKNYIFSLQKDYRRLFVPQTFDRFQILDWESAETPGGANPDKADYADYNYEISGYALDTISGVDVFGIFIKYDGQPDFKAMVDAGDEFYWVEMYRQALESSNDIAYEIGPTYDVSQINSVIRLSGYGDTFNSFAKFTGNFGLVGAPELNQEWVQRPSLHANDTKILSDHGRAVVEDSDAKQEYVYNEIRVSGAYSPNSGLNKMSSFASTDYIRVPLAHGPTTKLVFVSQVLLAIGQNKTQPIYVGKDRVLDLSSQTLVGKSSALLNLAAELQYDAGTKHPESVAHRNGQLYAWDVQNGMFWRYSTNGIDPLTMGMKKYFFDISRVYSGAVPGGIYPVLGLYIATINGQTWAFDMEGGWSGRFSFVPEFMTAKESGFVSWNSGALYVHGSGDDATFRGVYTAPLVEFVVNSLPGAVKLFHSVKESASEAWELPYIYIPDANMYSKIPYNRFKTFKNQFWSVFLRDENDSAFDEIADIPERLANALLRGRHLQGEVMVIRAEGGTNINSVEVEFS